MNGLYMGWNRPIPKAISIPKQILSSSISPVTFYSKESRRLG